MSTQSLLLCFVIAIFWGGWPLVMNASSLKDPFLRALVLNAVTVAALLPLTKVSIERTTILSVGMAVAIVAGVMNGVGHGLFQKLQLTGGGISTYNVLIPVLCGLVNAVGGPIFFGEPFTVRKTAGTFLAFGAIWLLSGK